MQSIDTSRTYDRSALIAAIAAGWRPKYLPFWGYTPKSSGIGKHVLSQWWPAPFKADGESYASAEHFMMAEKARLFGDMTTRRAILSTTKPGAAKALGRTIAGFDEAKWEANRFRTVVVGNLLKFGGDAALKEYLLETGDKVLVEASPVDRVWGIGLAAADPRAERPEDWPGLNLLGFALMCARDMLRAGRYP
jgi:ribA/ribD-fused uncharacterized protein